jgi:hypothetical protein
MARAVALGGADGAHTALFHFLDLLPPEVASSVMYINIILNM